MKFDLKTPCKSCPFKTRTIPYITTERAEEISVAVMNDNTFTCHKTLDLPENKHQHCAGTMLFLEKQNRPNQMMRIAERFGDYKHKELDTSVSVYDSPEDMVRAVGIWNGDIDE